jgi:hypothetical protein
VEGELAESWTVSDDGLEWTFTMRVDSTDGNGLRPISRDWNGFAVPTSLVPIGWGRRENIWASERMMQMSAASPRVTDYEVIGDDRVRVRTSEPVTASWFARPDMAVIRLSDSGRGWPIGTGPVRPTDLTASGADSTGSLSVIPLQGSVPLEARVVTGDPRSALEAGADVLVTDDPQVIDYASASPDFTTLPFAWDRSWALLTPVGMPFSADSAVVRVPGPFGSTIPSWQMRVIRPPEESNWARDVVPLEARPPDLDRAALSACTSVPTMQALPERQGRAATGDIATPRSPRARRIVYRAGDAVGRALAERLIALALDPTRAQATWLGAMLPDLAGSGPRPTAVGLDPAEFATAVKAGLDAGYVVAAERSLAMFPCESLARLTHWAPWLALPADVDALTPAPATMLLADTRSTLVLRREIVGAAVDGSGVIQLGGVRRVQPEPRR